MTGEPAPESRNLVKEKQKSLASLPIPKLLSLRPR